MNDNFVLPECWYIDKAADDYEAELIAKYADPLNMEYDGSHWSKRDSFDYMLNINNGKYAGGTTYKKAENFVKITFQEFENYVLDKKQNYDYLIKLFKKLNIQ